MRSCVTVLFLLPLSLFAQDVIIFDGTARKPLQKDDIFRMALSFHLPEDEYVPLTFNYERKLGKQLTFYSKAGPAMMFNNQPWDSDDFSYSMNAYASAELRFYFNQLRRERKEKKAHNFSSNYISLEQYMISNPLWLHNRQRSEGQPGSTGSFLNIGFQREFGGLYLNVYWGPRLSGSLFGNWPGSLSTSRGCITLGALLFNK